MTINAVVANQNPVVLSGQEKGVVYEQIPHAIEDFTLTGGGYSIKFTATAAVPPITYRLAAGSTIVHTPPTPSTLPAVPEPLSGTFVMRVTCSGAPGVCYYPSPNTLFTAEITAVSLQSQTFTVAGTFGYVDVTTLNDPIEAYLYASVLINGEPLGLNGAGPFDAGSDPPAFGKLEVCAVVIDQPGCAYQLTLFPVPDR
jgi:hypothetical protein